MTNLENLERVFFLNLLRQWLKLNEVAKLDSAFTTSIQRHVFLELLSKCNCKPYVNSNDQILDQILIAWMSRRNIPFSSLTVSSDTLNSSTNGIFGSETLTSLSCSHFWQQKQKIGDSKVISPINQIFSTIPKLSEIKLTNSKFVTGLDVTINCPHLTGCDFTFLTKLTDDFVVNLSQKCPQLTRVVLSQCKLLTDTSIVSLVKSCKALSFLHIGGCKKLTSVSYQCIASECSQLTVFNIDYQQTTSGKSISSFGGFGAASGTTGSFRSASVSVSHEDMIIDIIRNNPLLTELYVRDSCISNKTLIIIAERLPNFRVLDFSDCVRVTDEGLVPLAESCKLLSELIYEPPVCNVSGTTQRTFLAIVAHCPEFKRFRLSAQLITKAVLSVVSMDIDCVDLAGDFLDCSHFRSADGGNDRNISKLAVKDKVFNLLAPYCTGAHTYRCDNQHTEKDTVLFLQHMSDIKHLDLVCLRKGLTDQQLIALSNHLTKLESVVFTFPISYSNNALLSLTKNNRFLTKLDIGHCEELDDATLAKIAEHCRELKWLNIRAAYNVLDVGIMTLANNCRRLQYLNAYNCALTDVGILGVIARCKALHTFRFNTDNFPDRQVQERYECNLW